jgi:hypothetical protein
MAETKILKLHQPIEGLRGEKITQITFREPKFSEYMAFGEVETLVGIPDSNAGFYQEDLDAIRKYMDALVEIDPNFLMKLGLRDAVAAKRIVLSFFREAIRLETSDEAGSSSESRENSSSDTDNQFRPSTI